MSRPKLSRPIHFKPAPMGAYRAFLGFQYLGLVVPELGNRWAAYRAPGLHTNKLDGDHVDRDGAAYALIEDLRLIPEGDQA